ncbi:MAG: hypothetical protein U0M15_09615 [Bacillota bacterium]|nr:hypothetical protein [Bacillota bacterium]
MEIAVQWFLYFFIYAVLGWVAETVYCSVFQHRFMERGFLNGPYCPIYGFGAIVILIALEPCLNHPAAIFLLGMLLTSLLEYITSVIMEKLFHMRWWDYSAHRFNIHGRVCLLNSTMFGLMCLLLTMVIHPFVTEILERIPFLWREIAAAILLGAMAVDTTFSVRATLQLGHHLEQLKETEEKLRQGLSEFKDETEERFQLWKSEQQSKAERTKSELISSLDETKDKMRGYADDLETHLESQKKQFEQWNEEQLKRLKTAFASLKKPQNRQERRLLRSFPHLESKNHKKLLNELRAELEKHKKHS